MNSVKITVNITSYHVAPGQSQFSHGQTRKEKNVEIMNNPTYSPILAPCDFFMFTKVKNQLRGQRFSSPEEALEELDVVAWDGLPLGVLKIWLGSRATGPSVAGGLGSTS
ncbi:hypothetical protein EVAR_12593_1 [Eumeta japonica]|uniref:Histone-lysine N-methyltransferase SETMAR n=1 Tax=Eumeta variegata TaxID=151549 RepID=A0A4C1UG41_EUMVA|nr:hypothetical protein EVAR_12593_1 [Eumeta japonica]